MIRKIRFYLDNMESEIYEYNDIDENWEEIMENDRTDWIFSNIESGYIELKPNLHCVGCHWTGFEEDLKDYNKSSDIDNTTLEYFKGCPNCKTDQYLENV